MSGGGGGTPYIESTKNVDCLSLSFNTRLSSPVAAVIGTLIPGDELDLNLKTPPGAINAIDNAGRVAGTILGKEMAKLAECIIQGVGFVAVVIKIEGGNCQVRIKAK